MVLPLAFVAFTPTLHAVEVPPVFIERTIELKSGETLSGALNRAGISAKEAHNFIIPLRKKVNMARFRPGQKIEIHYTELALKKVGKISEIAFHTQGDKTATATRQGNKITAKLKKRPLTKVRSVAVGEINGSLYMSAKRAKLPAALVPSFANLFAYELDFTRDIHKGDAFKVVFEEIRDEDGEFLRTGNILAAELTARGKKRTAYRYKDGRGIIEYYDENGRPKKKLLMRTPLEFSRISSNFNLKRKHPVLGYTRAHKGTDFAAPRGTPIKASGSGKVVRAGRFGSFGNYILIKHNNTYKTAYAHLNKIARGVRAGKRVKQGQIIGYVGTTGRSTGPHLHYEVHKHGKAINAMSARIPAGNPLPKRQRLAFKRMVAEFQNQWSQAVKTQLASK